MQSPSSVDHSDENILGTLWAQFLFNFVTDCFETFQMFSAWNEVHVIFSDFFCFVNLVFFQHNFCKR